MNASSAPEISVWAHLADIAAGVALPCAVIVAVVTVPIYVGGRRWGGIKARGFGVVLTVSALLGLVIGIFSGASTTPVMGDVLPALLTFISGLALYLLGKDALERYREIIPPALMALLITAVLSAFLGSSIRGDKEQYERRYKEWLLEYEKVDLEIKKLSACAALKLPCEGAKK